MYDLSFDDFAFASDEETVVTCIVTLYSRRNEDAPRVFESRATTRWRKAGTNDGDPDDELDGGHGPDEDSPTGTEAEGVPMPRV